MIEHCACGGPLAMHIPMKGNQFLREDAYKECAWCKICYPSPIADSATVSCKPTDGLLASMALRYRHDFGILPADEQKTIMAIMRQIHEEVVGKGFYKPEHEEKYLRALNYDG